MNEPRPPEIPPTLVPGQSAAYWLRRAVGFLFFATVPFAAAVLTAWFGPSATRDSLIVVEFTILVVLAAFVIGSAIGASKATARERRAGYTTYGKGNLDLWYLDDRTGEVLRRPDEGARR